MREYYLGADLLKTRFDSNVTGIGTQRCRVTIAHLQNMASEEKSPPSLQELCEKMSLQEVLPKASFAEFAALEPRLQQLLYNALQEEVTRLREVKQKWEDFKNYCPRTDLQLLDNLGRTEAADGGTEGYRLSDEFRSKWTYRSEGVRAHWVHGTV